MMVAMDETASLRAENNQLRVQLGDIKALREREAWARQNNQHVQTALAAGAILGTWNWHPTRDCFTVDEGFAHAFGHDIGLAHVELTIDQVLANVHSDDRPGLDAAIEAAVARGGAYVHQYRVRRADGKYYWIEAIGRVDYDPDGVPASFPGIVIDVNERRSLEAERNRVTVALRKSEARVQAMVEQSSAGIAQTTLDGQFVFVNDRYCSMVGRTREELLSLRMHALTHPDDLPGNAEQFRNLAQGGRSFEIEKRYLRPDGATIWVRNSVTGVRETDGRVGSIVAVSLDISEQKGAAMRQAFLLRLTDQLRMEDTAGAVMAVTADLLGRHLGASRVGYALVQPDDKTVVFDRSYVNGVAPLTGSHALADYDAVAIAAQRRGETFVSNDTQALPTRERWAAIGTRAFVSVPRIRDGCFRASFYVNHRETHAWSADEVTLIKEVAVRTWDAVERARAEAALREANDTLEQRIATALAERERIEEALRQSQKMEAVGQLTGGLAHDFNNLLGGISGSLELMQTRMQQGRFQDVERYIAAAQGAAKRAAALTHRLLAFSRRQTLDSKPTDVNRLVAGMQELIQRTVGPGIPIEVVGAVSVWPALVDPSQLENALLNLCINARDAMPDGGHITIETANKWVDERDSQELDMPEGQYFSMCVTDTGIGMPPEVIARAFEPFFTTKPIGEGTGLGLSMIYGFAHQSGGQVRIYSEVGKGTTVCVYLPRHYGQITDDGSSTGSGVLPHSEQGETVLVVDDEPTVRMLVTDILEDLGYTAIEAGDSAAGLKVLQSNVRIDLLVTDVGLPGGMNGRQMADAARVSRPDLKVLFITGYAENAILGNGHLAPGMAVLTKPFLIETMATRIHSMIEGGKEQARHT